MKDTNLGSVLFIMHYVLNTELTTSVTRIFAASNLFHALRSYNVKTTVLKLQDTNYKLPSLYSFYFSTSQLESYLS